ncbi:MAG: flagellar hook-length control protein FliK [Phycisphaerales bacterium]|nr:flagellar hook-length control protein FliK [Phycisphaerales bacterium]MCB9836689.1 flagellar hook-length control protein FliK [Phycisphaera sp.]
MIQSIAAQNNPIAEKEPAKRSSAESPFAEALQFQTDAILNAALDPTLTASLPGAGTALVEADPARQDVSELAARELVAQQDRQSTRDRGTDAASQARQSLAERAQTQAETSQSQPTESGFKPVAAERGEGRFGRANSESDEPAPSRADAQTTRTSASASQMSGPSSQQHTSGEQQPSVQTQAATGPAANVAATGTAAQASNAASGGSNASGAVAVSQASGATSKGSSPTALPGQSTSPARPGGGGKQAGVIKHQPRTFEAQLQRGLAQVLRQKGGTLSLKLDPVDLGSVKVSLKMSQGRVEGSIEASNEQARGLLQDHLDTLKSSLEQRGITVDRLDVRLAGAAESGRQFGAGQEAGQGLGQHNAGAGGDRQSGSFRGEDRQAGDSGGTPGERMNDGLRGAEPTSDDWHMQGGMAEPLGGWLRLDTVA